MRLSGKRALVTGAGQGIGRAIALRLGQEGADVVVNYLIRPEDANEVRDEIETMGRRAAAIQADVSDVSASQTLIERCSEALGGLDILVNNAGIEKRAPFLEATRHDYDAVIAVNMTAPFFLTQAFARHLRDRKRPGKVINISSIHDERPFPHFTSYCMSKGGLKMMMRNLAVELAPLGITVNNVAPGAIRTPINERLEHDPTLLNALLAQIPLHRMGQPEDVAHAVAYLASPEADYVTGADLVVDGGLLRNYSEQ